MLLFKAAFHEGLKSGDITLTFRLWDHARVKAGTNQRTHPIGVLHIDDVREVPVRDIPEAEARKAGFADRATLLEALSAFSKEPITPATKVFRVALHYVGENDRIAGAEATTLSPDERAGIAQKLDALDARGAWTRATLALIAQHPRTAASQLAAKVARETAPFKADVVKLKKLGLTESFEVGYALTPRGQAFVASGTK